MENVARNYPVITTEQDWPTSVLKINSNEINAWMILFSTLQIT